MPHKVRSTIEFLHFTRKRIRLRYLCNSMTNLQKIWHDDAERVVQSINQSINVKFVGRRYTRRPGAPTVVSGTHDQKVHS